MQCTLGTFIFKPSCLTLVSKTEEQFQLMFHVPLNAFHEDLYLV